MKPCMHESGVQNVFVTFTVVGDNKHHFSRQEQDVVDTYLSASAVLVDAVPFSALGYIEERGEIDGRHVTCWGFGLRILAFKRFDCSEFSDGIEKIVPNWLGGDVHISVAVSGAFEERRN